MFKVLVDFIQEDICSARKIYDDEELRDIFLQRINEMLVTCKLSLSIVDALKKKQVLDMCRVLFTKLYKFFNQYADLNNIQDRLSKWLYITNNVIMVLDFALFGKLAFDLLKSTMAIKTEEKNMFTEINKIENILEKLSKLRAKIYQIKEEFQNCESTNNLERIAKDVDYLKNELNQIIKELENTKIKLNKNEINLKQLKSKAQVDSFISKAYGYYSVGTFVYNIVTRNYAFAVLNMALGVGAAGIASKHNENATKCEELLNNLIDPLNDCDRLIEECRNASMRVDSLKIEITNMKPMMKLKEENSRVKQENLRMNEEILKVHEENLRLKKKELENLKNKK